MAITCPRCGADFDVTLFQFGHRVRCGCGAEVGYPGVGLRDGHIATDVAVSPKSPQAAAALARGQEWFKQALEEIRRGHKDLAAKALDAAIHAYTEAIGMDPKHATAYLLRARAYEEKGDEIRAESDLVRARALEAE